METVCRVIAEDRRCTDVAKLVADEARETPQTALDNLLKRSIEGLRVANNVLGSFDTKPDPDHVPAWTKRRKL